MIEIVLMLLLAFLATVFSSTFGMGTGLILIPLLSFLIPIKKAIGILAVFFIAVAASKSIAFRKNMDWKTIFLIWSGAFPLVILGSFLLVGTSALLLEKLLGAIIILYVLNDYFKLTKNVTLGNYSICAIGGIYGFTSGIIGDGSAVKAALLSHIGLRKEEFIAVMAMTALPLNIIKAFIYAKFSIIESGDLPLIIGLSICAIAGAYVGKSLVRKVSAAMFRKVILILLLAVSAKLIFF